MNLPIKVVDIELVRRSSDISFFEPVSFEDSMNLADHNKMSDIKFSSFIEQRSIYVQLNNKCFLIAVVMFFLGFHDRI
jgi:hypothetical protein